MTDEHAQSLRESPMHLIIRTTSIGLCFCLAACGHYGVQNTKVAHLPPEIIGGTIEISEVRPTTDDVLHNAYEVPNRSVFFQQSSGGSAAVGLLLLGPLAQVINPALVDRKTSEMAASASGSSLFQLDAKEEADVALKDRIAKLPRSNNPTKMTVKPYLMLYTEDDKSDIDVVVCLRIDSTVKADDRDRTLTEYYVIDLDDTLPHSALTNALPDDRFRKVKSSIEDGYNELFDEFEKDLKGGVQPSRDVAAIISIANIGSWGAYGYSVGEVERNSRGHLTMREMPRVDGHAYQLTIFTNDKQFSYKQEPEKRETR